jgi:phospholipid transport system substrate-binding protein
MKRRLIAVFILFSSFIITTAGASPAQPGNAALPANNPAAEPAALLRQGITSLTRFIQSGTVQDQATAMAFLKNTIAPYFDFAYMARWSAGPAWRNMPDDQKIRLEEQITSAFLATLARNLSTYSNQQIRYFTPRGQRDNDIRVNAWIMQPQGQPTRLEFRFYRSASGWKVFDVKANGNSAVIHYRNRFRQMYRTGLAGRPAG